MAGGDGEGAPDGGVDDGDGGDGGDRPDRPDGGDAVYKDYVYTIGDDGLNSFSIDAATMTLTDFADASNEYSLSSAADPRGRFLFVTERQANDTYSIVAYSINQTTGRVSEVDALATTHTFPSVMAVNPAGTMVFVGDAGASVVASYAINQTTGALSAIDTVSVAVSASSYNDLQINPSGNMLYVGSFAGANDELRTIQVSATGELTLGAAFGGDSLGDVYLEAAGRFLYTGPRSGSGDVKTYRVDATTGMLTFLRALNVGETNRVVSDPEGNFLYVAGDTTIKVYGITAADGALTFKSNIELTDPNSQRANVFSLSFHLGGGALYALSRDNNGTYGDTVHPLRADPSTGALTSAGPVATSLGYTSIIRAVRREQP